MDKKKFIFLLIFIGILIYFNSLFNGFVWDDEEQVVNNPLVHSLTNLPFFFRGSTFNPGGGQVMGGLYYKPIMTVCFSFLYTLFGPKPFFFHLLQLILHLTNAVFVFLLLDHFLKKLKLSFFLSLIFLIHPINVEAVVYVSALQDVLFFFFGMITLLMVIKEKNSQWNYFLVSLFLLLSFLAKETGIIFFAIIFCYLLFIKKERISSYLVSFLLTVWIYGLLRFAVAGIPLQKHNLSPITRMDFWHRLITIPKIILFYLRTFFYPKDLAISQHWVVEKITWSEFWLPLAVVCLFFIGIVTLFLRLKDRKLKIEFLFFFLWFIFSLGFHLQIFPLDLTVSDRWFYLPMVGMVGMVGIFVGVGHDRPEKRANHDLPLHFIINIGFIILIILLSLRTVSRAFDWRNGLTLYNHDIKISKDAFDLENNLGVELFRKGKFNQAKTHFERSTKLAPYWWTNWNNLGVIYERKRDYQKAEKYYKKAIDNGNYYLAFENYAGILIKQKKNKEAKEFLEKEALPKLPYNQKLRQMYWYLTQEK